MITTPNLLKILRPFENKWVALSSDQKKVLASGKTLSEVESKLNKNEIRRAVLFKVFPFKMSFSG